MILEPAAAATALPGPTLAGGFVDAVGAPSNECASPSLAVAPHGTGGALLSAWRPNNRARSPGALTLS